MGRPRVSIIVPVRNEADFIGPMLESLLAQNFPRDDFEILVCDGLSDDSTPDIVRQYARVHSGIQLLANPRRWSSAARNLGIRHSSGELLLIVDGHCQLNERKYLQHLCDAFARWDADCVGRPQPLDVTGASLLQRAIAAARKSWLGHHPDSFIYASQEQLVPAHSVAVAYRRSVFETIGMFDERFDACEDVELNHRVDQRGLRCVLCPDIALKYHPRSSLRSLFYQLYRYGRGRMRLLCKHADTFSFKTLIPLAFVVTLAAGITLPLWPTTLQLLWAAIFLLYTLLVVGTSARLAACSQHWRIIVYLPLVFFTLHLASGSGLLAELVGTVVRGGLPRRDRAADSPSAQGTSGS